MRNGCVIFFRNGEANYAHNFCFLPSDCYTLRNIRMRTYAYVGRTRDKTMTSALRVRKTIVSTLIDSALSVDLILEVKRR